MPPRHGLFIAGTDTHVGKTFVTALIARQLVGQGRRVGVYKPVASGCRRQGNEIVADDALALWRAAGQPLTLDAVCPQRFLAPLAPHLAAAAEARQVDEQLLWAGLEVWNEHCDIVLVEGIGGLMSPLTETLYVADLAHDLPYAVLIVAPNKLGAINQTLQTLITAATFRDGLDVLGIVLNDIVAPEIEDPSRPLNRGELEQRCRPPVLAHVGWQAEQLDSPPDWFQLASDHLAAQPP